MWISLPVPDCSTLPEPLWGGSTLALARSVQENKTVARGWTALWTKHDWDIVLQLAIQLTATSILNESKSVKLRLNIVVIILHCFKWLWRSCLQLWQHRPSFSAVFLSSFPLNHSQYVHIENRGVHFPLFAISTRDACSRLIHSLLVDRSYWLID